MRREAEFFAFLLLNELNKCIETHVEKKWAETIPMKDAPARGDSRGSKVISNKSESCHKD